MDIRAWSVITVSLFVKRNNSILRDCLEGDAYGEGDHWEVVSGWTLWGECRREGYIESMN